MKIIQVKEKIFRIDSFFTQLDCRGKIFIFRVNANDKIGYGHLVRSTVLAKMVYRKGGRVIFATNYPREVKNVLEVIPYDVLNLEKFESFSVEESEFLLRYMKRLKNKIWFIVDSYKVSQDYLIEIREKLPFVKTIAIDDLNEKFYPVDILINGNIYAKDLNYERQRRYGTKLLLGMEYLLLRDEFKRPFSRKIRESIKDVLITLGGGDKTRLMEKILSVLVNADFKDVRLHLISGYSFYEKLVRKFEGMGRIFFYHKMKTKEIRELMIKSDIAISGGGGTLYELLSCGTPTIAVKIADNQSLLLNKLERMGIVRSLNPEDGDFEEKLIESINSLKDENRRNVISRESLKLFNFVTKEDNDEYT